MQCGSWAPGQDGSVGKRELVDRGEWHDKLGCPQKVEKQRSEKKRVKDLQKIREQCSS